MKVSFLGKDNAKVIVLINPKNLDKIKATHKEVSICPVQMV